MNIPSHVDYIIKKLQLHGFLAYVVGGAVRDFMLGKKPHDWDITTTAFPQQITQLFSKAITVGQKHGTVTVIEDGEVCEVSTLAYQFSKTINYAKLSSIEKLHLDLQHRDFTVNAIAYDVDKGEIIDCFGGVHDLLYKKILRCVENPTVCFIEDPLRLLRAIRLSNQLKLAIDNETVEVIKQEGFRLSEVSVERIRQELSLILLIPQCRKALIELRDMGLLMYMIPELLGGVGLKQGSHHRYDVFMHTVEACAVIKPQLHLRLAALLHDIGKPTTAVLQEEGWYAFPEHHIKGTEIGRDILKRLHYSHQMIAVVTKLIENHMFYYRPGIDSTAILRKLIGKIGVEQIWDLVELRRADIFAMNPDWPDTYLTELKKELKNVLAGESLYWVKNLALSGTDVCDILHTHPGPWIREILEKLLEIVQKEPKKNNYDKLKEILLNMD